MRRGDSSSRSQPLTATADAATSSAEPSAAEFAALRADLLPFAHRQLGSLRIDMSDVRVIMAALDLAMLPRADAASGLREALRRQKRGGLHPTPILLEAHEAEALVAACGLDL